ncbi:MAG: metallophosphoesterase [Clostridia bacterium]|nr:metallophosphoesterase [Clostridia bacterium]
MKIIHISDLHLDSKLETNFDPLLAKQRNNEMLVTLENLFDTMESQNFDAMIIAGDMFDTKKVSSKAFTYIIDLIKKHNSKKFFYVSGNHDKESELFNSISDIPENLFVFNSIFSRFELSENVLIGGVKLDETNCTTFPEQIDFPEDTLNIMVMHGAITKSASSVSSSAFLSSSVKNKNIDYLALGHIHEYSQGQIDKRCTYVYSGCLEPRGFDEIGDKGYVSILIDETTKTISHDFVKFSSRTFHEIPVDISEFSSNRDILNEIYQKTQNIPSTDIVKVILAGTHNEDFAKSTNLINEELSSKFYFVKITDKSRLKINAKDYENDISLKGCFIRKVLASKLSEQDKSDVIVTGLKALSGEEVE